MVLMRLTVVGLVQKHAEQMNIYVTGTKVTSAMILILTFTMFLIIFVPIVVTLLGIIQNAKIDGTKIVLIHNVRVLEPRKMQSK